MVSLFVTRVRQLLTGFTRVTFGGCGGDPDVWEQAASRRWRERRTGPVPHDSTGADHGRGPLRRGQADRPGNVS
jgi:hypothetical protein